MAEDTKAKCRYCGAMKLGSDPDYCSGKCKKADGRAVQEPELKPDADRVGRPAVEVLASAKDICATKALVSALVKPGSLADYYARPDQYHRRFEPERLNWGKPLNAPQLKQAGLRANRVPIPGDWDYEEPAAMLTATEVSERREAAKAEKMAGKGAPVKT